MRRRLVIPRLACMTEEILGEYALIWRKVRVSRLLHVGSNVCQAIAIS